MYFTDKEIDEIAETLINNNSVEMCEKMCEAMHRDCRLSLKLGEKLGQL